MITKQFIRIKVMHVIQYKTTNTDLSKLRREFTHLDLEAETSILSKKTKSCTVYKNGYFSPKKVCKFTLFRKN